MSDELENLVRRQVTSVIIHKTCKRCEPGEIVPGVTRAVCGTPLKGAAKSFDGGGPPFSLCVVCEDMAQQHLQQHREEQ